MDKVGVVLDYLHPPPPPPPIPPLGCYGWMGRVLRFGSWPREPRARPWEHVRYVARKRKVGG